MGCLRMLGLAIALLCLHTFADASAIREMLIEISPNDVSTEELQSELANIQSTQDNVDVELDLADFEFDDQEYEDETKDDVEDERALDVQINDVGHWWGNKKIAFTAYLSSDKTLGKSQHIKFDQVLLNDGNGYEPSTGIFRAPVSGVYSFTYVIAQRHSHEIRTNLIVDGKVAIGAIAEGAKLYIDVQGTNTVNVHVCKGKPVWVEAYSKGKLEGDDGNYRYTSFSGHILYARK